MRKKILGFSTIAELQIHTPGLNSPVGEMSTWAETYSMEKGEYWDPTVSGYRFISMSSRDANSNQEMELSAVESSQALRVTRSIHKYALDHLGVTNPSDFLAAIKAEYYAEIDELQFGDLVDGAGIMLPSWFSFTSKLEDLSNFKIWLSDGVFLTEYPEYHHKIIRPVADPRIFLRDWALAVNELNKKTLVDIVLEAQTAKNLKPETVFTIFETDYVNKYNPDDRITTNWGVLIYGAAGDNNDAIKDAVIKDLVEATGAAEHELEPWFPDLFKRTEFVIFPRWDLHSVPNMTTLSGLYSPIANVQESLNFAVTYTNFMNGTHVRANTNIFPMTYKSVTLLSINGENNQVGFKDLKALYWDYIDVPSTSPDFQRMRPVTQEWAQFMLMMTIEAEKVTNMSVVPQGVRKINRAGKLFITATHGSASYLFAARSNPFYK